MDAVSLDADPHLGGGERLVVDAAGDAASRIDDEMFSASEVRIRIKDTASIPGRRRTRW